MKLLVWFLLACSWFAPSGTDAVPADDPAAVAPRCRPADAVWTRGEVPWTVGDATAGGWKVTAVDATNEEFVRISFEKDAATTILEVSFFEGEASEWTTAHYRLMPAKDQAAPPEALLKETMATLTSWDAAHADAPFVRKQAGVTDPYAGLPPCGPDGNPISG